MAVSSTSLFACIRLCLIASLLPAMVVTGGLLAQPTYTMQNALVNDCEGTLTDSDDGPETGQYDHNEDYTFTICVDNADEIIIAFSFFATEETYDVLAVYDGPDTSSPLLASLTGSLQPPPVLVATSGCVTFHFTSDNNIVAAGWELEWTVEIDEPVPPVFSVITMLECPISNIVFESDIPLDCDMLDASHFTVIGPGGPSVAQVIPLDCTPEGMGRRFEVIFSAPLSLPGTYRLLFTGAIQDACGEWHDVSATVVFMLSGCPFQVIIELVDEACAGDCGILRAVVIGDAGVAYSYQWSHTPLNQANVDVCTDVDINIAVTVTDPVSMGTATAQFVYTPLENPVILNPVQDTVCSSRGDHFYQSSLPGGNYYSSIIPENLQAAGRYQFWRWNSSNNLNIDIVTYVAPNGCIATDTVFVLPVNAGSIEAACVNGPDFQVGGGSPVGGTWSGPHITGGGVFSPIEEGSFWVNYTAPNGCVAAKRINVAAGIVLPAVDTICSSQEYDLVAEPYGGRWSGPGIVNAVLGRIRPWLLTPNRTYTYVYTLQGCTDTMEVYIQELWAGPDRTQCAADSLLLLPQPGAWTGPGVFLPAMDAFDISQLGPGQYDYTLSAFGCTDVFRLTLVEPFVDVSTTLPFCLASDTIAITDLMEYGPNNGVFSGPGILDLGGEWYINPNLAGPGMHTIYLEAAGCRDSFTIAVEPPAVIPDYGFCELSPAQILSAEPPGGTWSGPGFLDGLIGLFDPQLLTPGAYPITYTALSGCITQDTIDILLWQAVSITGVAQQYCYSDTLIAVGIQPPDGTFYVNGVETGPAFNPASLGTGTHELYYTRGTGPCASSRRIFISVTPPITGATSAPDSICSGENTVIEVVASGGTGTLRADWDQGLGFGTSHIVNPPASTIYTVSVTDGCSDPFTATAAVHVYQPFTVEILPGPAVCFTDTSHVEIRPPDPDLYAVYWLLDTLYESTYLSGQPGLYEAEVVELFSGCRQTYDAQIPGPPPLRANFSLIPNQPCIDIVDNVIRVIDLATGHTEGWIDFGDGAGPEPFVPGALTEHTYETYGDYLITLVVTNALGCRDTFSRALCVENRVLLYMPNVFSPNDDDINDVYMLTAIGITDLEWSVYSRFGEIVFTGYGTDAFWDGTHRGQRLNSGVFAVRAEYTDPITGERGERLGNVTLLR